MIVRIFNCATLIFISRVIQFLTFSVTSEFTPYEYIGRLGSTSDDEIRKISAIFVTKAPVMTLAAVTKFLLLPTSESLNASEAAAALSPSALAKGKALATASGSIRGSSNHEGLERR
jgi:hypothetical protein